MNGNHEKLIFTIDRKYILNTNVSHIWQSKMVKASKLRQLASEKGLPKHPYPELAQERFQLLAAEADRELQKSRITKSMKKAHATDSEIQERVSQVDKAYQGKLSKDVKVPFMFSFFRVVATICPPTRRRTDPPNLYPSIKPLIDGLTDSSWWEDDDFKHLVEVSFRYGGVSAIKGKFQIILDIYPVDNIKDYVIDPDEKA